MLPISRLWLEGAILRYVMRLIAVSSPEVDLLERCVGEEERTAKAQTAGLVMRAFMEAVKAARSENGPNAM